MVHNFAGTSRQPGAPLEIWGGAEYTCNRVGDRYFDQLDLSGHARRLTDLRLFAELGISALRCGVLWERQCRELSSADQPPGESSWSEPDAYLEATRDAGIRPIVGLVHHGSGPPHTSLLDPEFAPLLAEYAGQVAARYPWVDAYTPVNEPNTTARFAGRYGLWYPHHASSHSYMRALLHQVKGVVLSMRAIRAVRSDAKLVQTDDLGGFRSTPELGATADLMNERRWLTYDLLYGSVDRDHPVYEHLRESGLDDADIFWFRDNPCPPDVVGVNYYVLSDRFLDHRLDLYPHHYRSAEGPFADIEAVRVQQARVEGYGPILTEAHRRYGLPTAITEVHLGDGVEEQIRWAAEAWAAAQQARANGTGCQAITFWALMGSYFWNSLVTADNGHYEPGVFDLRFGEPRPTALAEIVRQLARREAPRHLALLSPGWWRRASRVQFDAEREKVA